MAHLERSEIDNIDILSDADFTQGPTVNLIGKMETPMSKIEISAEDLRAIALKVSAKGTDEISSQTVLNIAANTIMGGGKRTEWGALLKKLKSGPVTSQRLQQMAKTGSMKARRALNELKVTLFEVDAHNWATTLPMVIEHGPEGIHIRVNDESERSVRLEVVDGNLSVVLENGASSGAVVATMEKKQVIRFDDQSYRDELYEERHRS